MESVDLRDPNREDILEAALKVFAQKGYDSVGLCDIAEELKVSREYCEQFYTDKEEIHDALMKRGAEKLVPEVRASLEQAKARGEIQVADIDVLSYFYVYGQMGMLLSGGHLPNCAKTMQDNLMAVLES